MQCERFEEMLAEQIDGPLPSEAISPSGHLPRMPPAARRPAGHRCRRAGMGHRRARSRRHMFGLPSKPACRPKGLIAQPSAEPVAAQSWLSGWWNFAARLELAGAYVLAMLVAAGIAGYRNAPVAGTVERSRRRRAGLPSCHWTAWAPRSTATCSAWWRPSLPITTIPWRSRFSRTCELLTT